MAKLPDARSGLPKPIERTLVRPYSDTALHRVGVAAAVRALGVLVRKHPRAALDMAGAALLQAGRTGYAEVKGKLLPAAPEPPPEPSADPSPPPAKLDKEQAHALRKALEKEADDKD